MPGERDKLSSAHLGVDRQIAEEKASLASLRLRLLFLLTTALMPQTSLRRFQRTFTATYVDGPA
jgi:hypothetical protein